MSQDYVYRSTPKRIRKHGTNRPELREDLPDTPRPTSSQGHVSQLQQKLGNRATHTLLQRLSEADTTAHTRQCRCPACTGQVTIQSRTPLNTATDIQSTIQRCKYCNNNTCQDGEECGYGADMGGLFTPGLTTRETGLHGQTKKTSKRNVYESEHIIPHQAWRLSGSTTPYNRLPAMSIPYDMHRGGVSGAGGGVTSTGSSHTAKAWAQRLANKMRNGDMAGALLDVAKDEYNSAEVNGYLNESIVSQIMQTVNVFVSEGYISESEAGHINTIILNFWLNSQRL